MKPLNTERRAKQRFPLQLACKWEADGVGGTGTVVNMSSEGLFVWACNGYLFARDAEVTVRLDWPALIDERTMLLEISGRVKRSATNGFALRLMGEARFLVQAKRRAA